MKLQKLRCFNLKVGKLLQKSSNSRHQILCNLMNISCVCRVMSYIAVSCADWIIYEQYACHRHLMHIQTYTQIFNEKM